MAWVTVTQKSAIPEGKLKIFSIQDHRLAISHVDGQFYAIDDVCTHDNASLGEDALDGDEVECPRHGARFSVKTGDVLSMPAVVPVKIYKVQLDGDHIQVDLAD